MTLTNPAAFYAELRAGLLGPALSQPEVDGCEAILAACKSWPIAWTAYALATAWHETAHTLQPVIERGGEAYFRRRYDITGANPALALRLGNLNPGDGARYCGRGYVQLTGRANYERAERELAAPLIDNPDLAMRPNLAALILRRGMMDGWFTGRRLADDLPRDRLAGRKPFVRARAIINGTDQAAMIAEYAVAFQSALRAGGWSPRGED